MSDESDALYEASEGIATITLNRPQKLNAWTEAMDAAVREGVARAEADAAVRVIVLTGAGRGFCAGADMGRLSNISSGAPAHRPTTDPGRYAIFPAVSKPVIAAVNGPCAGLGLVLALYADIRIAGSEAMFTTAFARRGLVAEYGIAWILPRLVGTAAALDLLLSAREVRAEEALALGLVNRVVEAAALPAATREYARILADRNSPRSMRVMKRQVWDALSQDLGTALRRADEEMRGSFDSEDFREGVRHFVEKRPPAFTGR